MISDAELARLKDQLRFVTLTFAECSALIAEVERLRERVGFVEDKPDIEDMPESYGWAVNELTARKAYSKSECATLLAEQHERAKLAAAEVERLQHENATCASALMIARDARHAMEKRADEAVKMAVQGADNWIAATARAEAAEVKLGDAEIMLASDQKLITRLEAELAALKVELEKRT